MFGIAGRKEFYDLKEKDGNPGLGIRPFMSAYVKKKARPKMRRAINSEYQTISPSYAWLHMHPSDDRICIAHWK